MDGTIDMDLVVRWVKDRGHNAYVEHTGGGCATICAGDPTRDSHGDERWPAMAGAGWFTGPGCTGGRANHGDFYIGVDDGGDTGPTYSILDHTLGPVPIADLIVAQLNGDRWAVSKPLPNPVLGYPVASDIVALQDLGTVVAWGHVDALCGTPDEAERWCLLTLLPVHKRIANEANYLVSYVYPDLLPPAADGDGLADRLEVSYGFPNIVPAVEQYCELGMDW